MYVANVDRHVSGSEVRRFFEQLCGPVSRLRLLKEVQNSDSRIAFVEFEQAEGALAALNCSGAMLGGLALRISPSKTPVRDSGSKEPRRTLAAAPQAPQGAGGAQPSDVGQPAGMGQPAGVGQPAGMGQPAGVGQPTGVSTQVQDMGQASQQGSVGGQGSAQLPQLLTAAPSP